MDSSYLLSTYAPLRRYKRQCKHLLFTHYVSHVRRNQEAVTLEKAPKIAVYSPKDKMPWDDAVTMVLTSDKVDMTFARLQHHISGSGKGQRRRLLNATWNRSDKIRNAASEGAARSHGLSFPSTFKRPLH